LPIQIVSFNEKVTPISSRGQSLIKEEVFVTHKKTGFYGDGCSIFFGSRLDERIIFSSILVQFDKYFDSGD
jgi:hypothetical protein